jgi:hypothetical protein
MAVGRWPKKQKPARTARFGKGQGWRNLEGNKIKEYDRVYIF